jgi:hypothetical protein
MESSLTMNSICAPSEDIVAREIEGDIIIIPLVSGIGGSNDELYTLNETGQAIWLLLDGTRTLGEVAAFLSQKFAFLPEKINADVLGFAGEMTLRGFLTAKG